MKLTRKLFFVFIIVGAFFYACNKKDVTASTDPGVIIPPNPCAGKVFNVSALSNASDPCTNTGLIIITAASTGSTGYAYSMDGGPYQVSDTFSNMAPGDHIYLVKDNGGCSKSASINVPLVQAGPLFNTVKNILTNACVYCHKGGSTNKPDLTLDCMILSYADRIRVTVLESNGQLTAMPPANAVTSLSTSDTTAIRNWINAGARYTK